ncbi:TTL-domain-containing protein [Neocallimastix sp. 'constans']
MKYLYDRFPEFENISKQHLLMLSPSQSCKCQQRTVFFNYPNFINKTSNLQNKNDKVTELIIQNKEYFVAGIQNFSYKPHSTYSMESIREILKSNGIIRVFNEEGDVNLYWRNIGNSSIPFHFNAYQKYNHMLKHSQITRKDLLYSNFLLFHNMFPDDYQYMVETYTPENIEQFKSSHLQYQPSLDDLWLIKPKSSARGKNIRFFRENKDIRKGDIVTKYIADPLLIDRKKFDLRIYVLVTGHDPLKIYIYDECFARISTENYDLKLDDLNNLFKHLINYSVNKKRKKSVQEMADLKIPVASLKKYFSTVYQKDFTNIWEQIKDIVVKTLITVNAKEIKMQQKLHLTSTSLFELYGFDIIIDHQFKPWLLEVNLSPDISTTTPYEKNLKVSLLTDLFNLIGLVPYSHKNGTALEGDCERKNSTEEALQSSLCEFGCPTGDYERIFPKRDNISYYQKFFEKVSPNNKIVWDYLLFHPNE